MAKKEANIVIRLRDRASRGFKKLGAAVGKVVKVFGLLTAAAGAVGTILGARFLSGAIRSAGAFDERMSAVGAVTGATAAELEKLRDAADEAAGSTRFTADQAAAGLEELSRAGFSASDSIQTLNPVLDLAAGNNQTVAESAIQVTTALNAFGLAADQAGRVSDVYTRAAQRSAQTTQQLGQAMSFVAPVARQAGLTIEQASALVGRLADAGFRGSRGGTALRNALSQLQDPASSFSKALSDAGIESRNFIEVIEQLAEGGAGAEAAIRSLGLEAAPAIQALVAGGVPDLQKLTAELEKAAGASEEAATAMEDNLPGAIRSFSSAWDQFRRRLVAPLVVRIKEEIQDLTGALRDFTASGVLERFSTLLVNAFDSAVKVVREFVSEIDFAAVGRRLREFAENAAERFKRFSTDAAAVRRSFQQILGAIQLFAGSTITAFNAIATGVSGTFQFLNRQVERHLEALRRFTLGLNPIVNRALEEVRDVQRELEKSTDLFAARTIKSTELVAEGYRNLTAEVEKAAEDQATAQNKAAEAAEENARRTAATAEELDKFRESIARNREIVRGWDEQVQKAGQSAERTGEQVGDLGLEAEQTGTKVEQAGDQAEVAGEKQEAAAGRALRAWLDFGDGLEEVAFAADAAIDGTAVSLDQLRQQAEEAVPPFDRLRSAIAAAGDTSALEAVLATMNRLQEAGLLTENQVRELTEALLAQEDALRSTGEAANIAAADIERVGRSSDAAAQGVDRLGQSTRQTDEATAGFSGSIFGATRLLEQWAQVSPAARREVDKFSGALQNQFVTVSGLQLKLGLFIERMEQRFGPLNRALQDASGQFREMERASGNIFGNNGQATLTRELNVTIRVERAEQGPVSLTERDLNTIVEWVLAEIEQEQARTGP